MPSLTVSPVPCPVPTPVPVAFLEMVLFTHQTEHHPSRPRSTAVRGYTGTFHVTLLRMVAESQTALLEHQGCKRHFDAEPR